MENNKANIEKTIKLTMDELKDFQRATVNRIDTLYRQGQNRVLVADEVGLGKTMIAKGVIANTAKLRMEEQDEFFKVVYICSNQNIAHQNLRELDIFKAGTNEDFSSSRLSMQHLAVAKEEALAKKEGKYIQLIPLTPETSFNMKSSRGNKGERALIYNILIRLPKLSQYKRKLNKLLKMNVGDDSWKSDRLRFKKEVDSCQNLSENDYPQCVLDKLDQEANQLIIENLIHYLQDKRNDDNLNQIKILRKLFANISIDMLNPDLVIMDEFQRFKSLIDLGEDTDSGMLVKRFLSENGNSTDTLVRVLLLSATPYKPFTTAEELEENNEETHSKDFFSILNFLLQEKDKDEKISRFKDVWKDYSYSLKQLDGKLTTLKIQAENQMYQAICRTERISVMDGGDFIDDSNTKDNLKVSTGDILSYIQTKNLTNALSSPFSLPVEYTKSCPFVMSFSQNYKFHKSVWDALEKSQDKSSLLRQSSLLWLNKSKIGNYRTIPQANARLEKLKKEIFSNKSELLLWIPPSLSYYKPQGVYKNHEEFSKVLVFSSWVMVPRMIATLLSYEEERLTIGKLTNKEKSLHYFAKKRYPTSSLNLKMDSKNKDKPATMPLLSLLYPCKTFASMYNPTEYMNAGNYDLKDIENKIKEKINKKLSNIRINNESMRSDFRWYYLVPFIFDGIKKSKKWIESEKNKRTDDKTYTNHLERLELLLDNYFKKKSISLGKKPKDLLDVMVNIVLGSPAVCAYRAIGQTDTYAASSLAHSFQSMFNSPECAAIIKLAYSHTKENTSHWKDVLSYCKDGNFQAMIDEYVHMMTKGKGFGSNEEDNSRNEKILQLMENSINSKTITYNVDFKSRSNQKRMRTHFASGFSQGQSADGKDIISKDKLLNAFNSPFWPFVLASTSIGQEGLDFHLYCRKIMHWNLPNNPIDLEQREGRINRFKCLAIRQNIALDYGQHPPLEKDIWNGLFKSAFENKKANSSDLIPFWCLGENQKIKIKRIVPMYPISKDSVSYQKLMKILSLYRLTLGQTSQEELVEYISSKYENAEDLKKMFIDLSPFSKKLK